MKLYRKGADYERKIVKEAREKGMIAFRSAGSHSPIDLCIIDKEHRKILFVQCKTNLTNTMKKKIEEEFEGLKGDFEVNFEAR